MRKKLLAIFTIALFASVAARPQRPQRTEEQRGQKAAVDYISDYTRLVKQGDSTIIKLIGHVAFYHNGAFITCDSAYRYNERKVEAMGNVIINQDELNIYGDRVIYNGETNVAQIFSPLIKVVDEDAVMYTYHMSFNTETKVGEFWGGATITQQLNTMESHTGSYYASTKDVVMRTNVELDSEDYQMSNQEVWFNMNTENVDFKVPTNIWNKTENNFLSADIGNYDKNTQVYNFWKNSYILTDEQEGFSDTMVYYSAIDEMLMRSNIQLNDTVQKAMTFGDYGYYWNRTKHVIITRRPSAIMYEKDEPDSVFVRSDTIYVRPFLDKIPSRRALDSLRRLDSTRRDDSIRRFYAVRDSLESDSMYRSQLLRDSIVIMELRDLLSGYEFDSVVKKSLVSDTAMRRNYFVRDSLSGRFYISDYERLHEVADSLKTIFFPDYALRKDIRLYMHHEITPEVARGMTLPELDTFFYPRDVFRLKGKDFKELDKRSRKVVRGRIKEFRKIYADSIREARREERFNRMYSWMDEEKAKRDSLARDSSHIKFDSLLDERIELKNYPDSSDYLIRGIRNSKIWRHDVQAVGDTIIVETVDSTATLFGHAIMWNENNQITAERIRAYVKNGDIERARLFDKPIVAQYVENERYNQLTGEYMDALFRDQEIYKLVVNRASEAIYYREERDSIDNEMYVSALIVTSSTDMIIDLEESEISVIRWYDNIESTTYPIEMVPAGTSQKFKEFRWYDTLRPSKKDVFDRTIRTSIRRQVEAIEKPKFPITKSIHEHRRRLIEGGKWLDRNDKVRVTVNDFKKD